MLTRKHPGGYTSLDRTPGTSDSLLACFQVDSLAAMRRPRRSTEHGPPGGFLLAPRSGFRHYRWVVLAAAAVLVLAVVIVAHYLGTGHPPLGPVGSLVVLISTLAAATAGVTVGLTSALVGVLAAFMLLADFHTASGIANALLSSVVWCGAALGTGLVGNRLRRQVARRENELEQDLCRSIVTKDKLERVLDAGPRLLEGETLEEVARTACESAVATFGADSARVFLLSGISMEIVALCPESSSIPAGHSLSLSDFPDLENMLVTRRPEFIRDLRRLEPTEAAQRLLDAFGIVSAVRLPIVGSAGPDGVLALGWNHAVGRPDDEMLEVMQRFADQTAIAWHNALRQQAQRRADELHRTLGRVIKLAPSFHTAGSTSAVATAICNAALASLGCSAAAIYRVETDRLCVLERRPTLGSMTPGQTFYLSDDMPIFREIRSPRMTFIPDVSAPSRSIRPWPQEIVDQAGTHSALYVPLRFDQGTPENLMVLGWDEVRETPDEGFLIVVQRFADQAALALEHTAVERLHARLEASLLPTAPVEHPRLDVHTRYRTGEQRLHLGGDFVGSTADENGLLHFVLGDVSGHGPDAAALGATLRSTWKSLTLAGQSLPKIAEVMARLILGERNTPNAFATLLAGHADPDRGTLTWINAGHMPPLLIDDQVHSMESTPVPPLGMGESADYEPHHSSLPQRWSLLCYTDGLIDARISPGSTERYGEQRLRERLHAWSGATPDGSSLDELLQEVESRSGRRFADDVALLLITTKSDPTEAEQ